MYPKQVKVLIENAIEHPNYIQPIHLWGPPGVGKSAILRQVAEEHKIEYVDIRLAQRDPTDLRGIPAVVKEWECNGCGQHSSDFHDLACCQNPQPEKVEGGKGWKCKSCGDTGKELVEIACCELPMLELKDVAKWLPPPELPRSGRGILSLDELSSAPPLVQASAYQLCLDRRIGEYFLPNEYYVVAAGNRLEDRAVVYKMSTALANRFTHINVEVSLDDWVAWALSPKVNLDPNVVAFIHFKPELLSPKFNPESSEKAFASPRTWEFTARLVSTLPRGILAESLEGTIGKGATAEFMAFLKVQTELPDLNDIFNGKDFVPDRLDLKYALVSGLASRAKGAKQFERLIQFSEKLPGEFGVLMVTMLVAKDEETVTLSPSIEKWARKHSDVIISRKAL